MDDEDEAIKTETAVQTGVFTPISKLFAAQWNLTSHNLEDLPLDSSFAWLLCALVSAMAWIIYITYYNSRIVGFLLTKILNFWFIKQGYLNIGSFSISVLSGKVMFRDVAYINEDFSVRVQDGWFRFRWWSRYVKKSPLEDFLHLDARLSMLLNGFELHLYNRSTLYARLEQIMGLDPRILSADPGVFQAEKDDDQASASASLQENDQTDWFWRDLIPIVKIDISCGRVVFGNRLLPTTMLLNVEEAHLMYSTRPASNRVDLFTHIVKCRAENFKVILAPSPRYTGMEDEPPRFMGEGFVVFQSNLIDVYHYRDEPGLVPDEPEVVELADGLILNEKTCPVWELEIKCGKGTDFSYGPWADRQRDHLFKFFFPQDFQPLVVTKIAQPGERRQFKSFDVRLSTLADATIDTLFSKNKETMAVHMNVKPGSYLEMTMPWIVSEQGYMMRVNGQLLHLDASTSLQYRTLVESETLEFDVRVNYPLIWNDHQQYTCTFTGCKATANIIYAHKEFFQDLITDWASKSKPDLLSFVPYSWHFNLILKEFEVIVVVNEHNWIDCSSQHQENCQLAFCGELFDMSINLPFVDFLPQTMPIKFWIQGECAALLMYLPETNTSRNIVRAISNNCRLTKRDGTLRREIEKEKRWRNKAVKSAGWEECATVPIVALSITFIYHPIPPLDPSEAFLNITTPEKEELLLNPIRPPTGDGQACPPKARIRPHAFDPLLLPPDVVTLELEVGPSEVFLYGCLLRILMWLKENYVGVDQHFWDFDVTSKITKTVTKVLHPVDSLKGTTTTEQEFDPRLYRALEVSVSVTMHDMQAHLMKNCNIDDPPCPSIYLERFDFELHKTYTETKLQLLLSPVVLSTTDVVNRPDAHQHIKDGHLALSGLQVRGHAMFSDEGLPMDDDTIEYAWLVEVQLGHFTGRLTTAQLHHVVTCLETFILLAEDAENALQSPSLYQLCHHGISQLECLGTKPDSFCPTSEDIKYRMTRFSIESVNLFLVESGTALSLQVRPIRFSTCNLHGKQTLSGLTALLHQFHLRQYVLAANSVGCNVPGLATTNLPNGCASQEIWLEVGVMKFGPVFVDSMHSQSHRNDHVLQDAFLHFHDNRTNRLWFLWPHEKTSAKSPFSSTKCGCLGSCSFFGQNHNGLYFFRLSGYQEPTAYVDKDVHMRNHENSKIEPPSSGPSYGQSLLHEGKMLFDVILPSDPTTHTLSPVIENQRFSFTRTHTQKYAPIARSEFSEHSLSSATYASGHQEQENESPSNSAAVFVDFRTPSPTHTARSQMPIMGTPPFERTLSHPGSQGMATPSLKSTAVTVLPVRTNSIASFADLPRRRISEVPLYGANKDKRTPSITSLQACQMTPGHSLPGSPINGEASMGKTSPYQSLQRGRYQQQSSILCANNSIIGRPPSARNVRRTTSIGSESVHSLDIFYAAEDEHLQERDGSVAGGTPESVMSEHKAAAEGSSQSLLQTVIEIPRTISSDDRESNSISSNSFISAMSSQEDLALVDLHMQLNKPILDSPLLMLAYNAHMTKLTCSHWYKLPPLPHNTPQSMTASKQISGGLTSRWIPKFHPFSGGFTSIKIVDKDSTKVFRPPSPSAASSTSSFMYPGDPIPEILPEYMWADEEMGKELVSSEKNVSKHTIVFQFKGDIDVYISPLMLEASQRFIESVIPTLSTLHPLTIVNHLYTRCSSSVQSANLLKKEKYMYLSHLKELNQSTGSPSGITVQQPSDPTGSTYEETHTSHLQAFVNIAKVNISILQASIVEEVTSFSALDNLRDVTCVSLLLLSATNLSGKTYIGTQSKKAIQTLQVGNPSTTQHRKGKEARFKKSKTDWYPPEPISIETSEMQQEEFVISFDLKRVHSQLRRLKNNSSLLKESVLTVIPEQASRVFFAFEKLAQPVRPSANPGVDQEQVDAFGICNPSSDLDERMGFIMVECGVEDFAFKAVKRVGFEVNSSAAFPSSVPVHTGREGAEKKSSRPNSNSQSTEAEKTKHSESPQKVESGNLENGDMNEDKLEQRLVGDAASCVVDFKSVWFNFATPPHVPNTLRVDYTRLDWHMLSTATPAINSWLNPTNRLLLTIQKIIRESHYRQMVTVACLMAEALDAEGLHLPIRRKYNKLTPLAKTLREDPSCQLLTVLQRYVIKHYETSLSPTLVDLEATLSSELTPKSDALRKGIFALGRQWKNVLYMPSLMEKNSKMQKNQRPFSVSFAMPATMESTHTTEEDGDETEISAEGADITNETTRLLNLKKRSLSGTNSSSTTSSISTSKSVNRCERDFSDGFHPRSKKWLPSFQPRSSRASLAFPVHVSGYGETFERRSGVNTSMYNLPQSAVNRQIFLDQRIRLNESNFSLHSRSLSVNSLDVGNTLLSTPKCSLPPASSSKEENEDLYNWMSRQKDYQKGIEKGKGGGSPAEERLLRSNISYHGAQIASKVDVRQFDMTQPSAFNLAPLAAQLVDAHVIFKSLFTCLGVPSQIAGTTLGQKFGPNVTIRASLELLKMNIVESQPNYHGSLPKNQQLHHNKKLYINTDFDTPAFLCEKLTVEVDLREVQDLARAKTDSMPTQQNLIYASDGGFKKYSTVAVNFYVNINYVCQQVNLPLLRLLHQFSTMYQNACKTQMELKENRPRFKSDTSYRIHKKTDSSSGVESHIDGSKLPEASADIEKHVDDVEESSASVAQLRPDQSHVGTILIKPQSLSQRIRASTKGYMNLQERTASPLSVNLSETVIEIGDISCASDHTLLVEPIKGMTPRCWRTMFYLLDLYATMPETKTVSNKSPMAPHDISSGYKGNRKYEPLLEHRIHIDEPTASSKGIYKHQIRSLRKSLVVKERIPLVVFGVVKINCTRLLATLSGLKLESELSNLQMSHTRKEKLLGTNKKFIETSATGYLGKTMVVLLEGTLPNQQIIVKATAGKSQALYSGKAKRTIDKNSALITIGPINVDIPQHPIALHGMMTRSTKQLSSTLQELRAPMGMSRLNRLPEESDTGSTKSRRTSVDVTAPLMDKMESSGVTVRNETQPKLLHPIVVHFSIILDSLTIGASLLPSLKAQYHMGQLTSMGVTGAKAKFTVELPKHSLSFATKVQILDANLPSSASIELPPVHLSAEYVQQSSNQQPETCDSSFVDGAVLRKGNYLSAMANLGSFEHSLTTDLLNHLVFVQKVFMKEINEVVQKMSGGDRPVRVWTESEGQNGIDRFPSSPSSKLLYSIQLRLKGIQITATTPTNSAVRFETGALELQLSNRVKNLPGSAGKKDSSVAKLFLKAHVDLNVSLGQLHKHALFEEAEPEFQQVAYFKTRINLRNALQDEMISSMVDEKEAVLINLVRPLIYIQPVALDKAILVWLNYKNAYEYWNEQRASLNKEVLTATQQVLEKVPPLPQLGVGAHGGVSTLFLQLTVHDMGICLPLSSQTSVLNIVRQGCEGEPRAACVVTLESTRISACSSGSLVSKGRFSGLCIRFADDFETSLDDWKPDPNDSNIMNLCVVSEGTYEFCSRTKVRQFPENAKWILNVKWKMDGVAIHVDTNIGKHLSALAHTLTSLAGNQDFDDTEEESTDPNVKRGIIQDVVNRKSSIIVDSLPAFVFDASIDAKKRSRLIEKEMNEQAKIVSDLKSLGASQSTIEQEIRRLQELEALIFNDFRRDVIKKLRRQSMKQSFKEKFGLSLSSSKSRGKPASIATPTPTPEKIGLASICMLSDTPSGTPSSQASSPSHGHARTTSLDSARVTFSSELNPCNYDMSLGEKWPSVDTMDSKDLYGALNLGNLQQRHASVSTPQTNESSPITTTTTPSELGSDVEQSTENVPLTPSPSLTIDEENVSQFEALRDGASTLHHHHPGFSGMLSSKSISEPNIDFELDVKVLINSGKCVLHSKDYREEELRSSKGMGRERSFSNSTFEFPVSPGHRKRTAPVTLGVGGGNGGASTAGAGSGGGTGTGVTNLRPNASTAKLRLLPSTPISAMEFSLFLIPGLDVKVHYNSRTDCGSDSHDVAGGTCVRKAGMKKASLFAWMTLQSIPEETVITPHILDFLERALEPIPMPLPQPQRGNVISVDATTNSDILNDTLTSSLAAPSTYAYASFPVDVIVYLRIQPSTLRFSCLPISRVECLLRLPSLDLVISTKRAEDEWSGELKGNKESISIDSCLTSQDQAAGGLSVTACLSDFSIYIFHPYGGKKAGSLAGSSKDLSIREASPVLEAGSSDRKDALSVQLEFIKVNISRSRKVSLAVDHSAAVIRFSTICDIGSASFKYDMRRLTEILAFPKAWYRRSIMRRLFLGDQSTVIVDNDLDNSECSSGSISSSPESMSSKGDIVNVSSLSLSDDTTTSSSDPAAVLTDPSVVLRSHSGLSDKRRLNLDLPKIGHRRQHSKSDSIPSSPVNDVHTSASFKNSKEGIKKLHSGTPTPQYTSKSGIAWETLVLFTVNLYKLNIHMNMGNVMGNTIWTTRELKSQGRFSIGSSGHKHMFVAVGLSSSSFDAKGGIVGGAIEISHIDTSVHVKEDPGQEPYHCIGVKLFALESRLDYMGTSVLLGRVSALNVTVKDEWRIGNPPVPAGSTDLPTKRPAFIFVHGELDWDQLQMMISKSTTTDLVKMYSKLEEFFAQQFRSSKRVLSSLQPSVPQQDRRPTIVSRKSSSFNSGASTSGSQTPTSIKKFPERSSVSEFLDSNHHRHWQDILAKASGLKLSMLVSALPKHGTIMGGTMDLHGNNISLACYHGVNFRAKSWALFSLREPTISFATEAQDVINPDNKQVDTHIIQNVSFTLGHNITEHTRHIRMATVCRISRSFVFPPQFRSMQEWFHYAFVTSELDEVDRFPRLEKERRDSVTHQIDRQPRHSPKPQDYNHTMEMIFALPNLQLHLKTEHLQSEKIPLPNDVKPVVECSFITEFEDHIFVTVDAEAFFFLHDLITTYIKEKDRVATSASHGHSSKTSSNKSSEDSGVSSSSEPKVKVSDTTDQMMMDWRNYQCKTWHLEPTVRLLSWAGKQIEPYGVDYILHKLGFSHARITIPKWVQRGVMDPLDKVLSIFVERMINTVHEGSNKKPSNGTEEQIHRQRRV